MQFFTSDLHFFHTNIITYCHRPFHNVAQMNAHLVDAWNMGVHRSDTVYVIGDVSFGNATQTKHILAKLHGHKQLIVGNHDHRHSWQWWKEAGFDDVMQTKELTLGKYHVVCCHYPSGCVHDRSHIYTYSASAERVLLCGHVHDQWKTQRNAINVGVDVWNYAPIAEFRLIRIMEEMHVQQASEK